MTRSAHAIIALLTVTIAALIGLAAWQYHRAEQAEQQLGLDAGRVLGAVFTQARELRVARLTGTAVARAGSDGWVFDAEQDTRAPFAVNYFVDLRRVRQDDYSWDPDRRTMTVRIPDVTVEQPGIDMANAQVHLKGLWVSRKAAIALNRQSSQTLATTAATRSKSDENIAKARTAAIAAVDDFVRQPLAAAGFRDVTVEVRFPWEGRSSTEQWDRSRRPEEVLANRS